MRINIEWMAPWVYGRPFGRWIWHTYRSRGEGGVWIAGLFIHWTRNATTNGIGFSLML